MKVRLGFVSNSSSTSFTVSYEKSALVTLRGGADASGDDASEVMLSVGDFFDDINDGGDSHVVAHGLDNVRAYYCEQCEYDGGDGLRRLDEFVAGLGDGHDVSIIRIDDGDIFIRKFFDIMLVLGMFRALDKDGVSE